MENEWGKGFEWDRAKAIANIQRHKVAFEEAASVFTDPLAVTYPDPDHSLDEDRSITIGISSKGRLLFIAHAERGNRIRIISARATTPPERIHYEEER